MALSEERRVDLVVIKLRDIDFTNLAIEKEAKNKKEIDGQY